MTFQDQMKSDMAAVLFGNEEFEELILYFPAGSEAQIPIKAIVNRNPTIDGVFVDGEAETRTAQAAISLASDIGIPEPAAGDLVSLDGEDDWCVVDVKLSPNDALAILTLKVVEIVQKGAQAHFIRR